MTVSGHRWRLCLFLHFLLLLPLFSSGECDYGEEEGALDKKAALPLKIAAAFSILVCSAAGVLIPSLGKWIPAIRPENSPFFVVKSFAAGVILATAFIHILPDAFEGLSSPCLDPIPWQSFPFAGFAAMMAAIGTLMIDTIATGYFTRVHTQGRAAAVAESIAAGEAEKGATDIDVVDVEGMMYHMTHGHSHAVGTADDSSSNTQLIRHRIIAQVLELGILVHSVIIGISLGVSNSPSTLKPLLVALIFHQFLEGMGLGGCIAQARFKVRSMLTMGLFFSLTTPAGVVIGIGISSVYNENSPSSLITQGILDSVAAGILIYMALVDLLAADFMNPKVQSNVKLQVMINFALLLGAGLMSLLAKWA
ncbi:zinc transporter 5-like [Zingiber officinale]|uniref:Uncharacterized protein n=1 Tax=Zingiber officinale TaxID=94328 RepID=A0A8J5GCK7_ZINOF|nr:zinc transporter 5-like [Zingiber officinale]KAG6503630.1 hypothetical protein ZIOFF_035947 [Zingiber officinale]